MAVLLLGVYTDSRTRDMFVGCQNAVMRPEVAAQVQLAQGSYMPASRYSGSTHSGGGALDVGRFRKDGQEWTWDELCEIASDLRQVGFAAWPRERIEGLWERHVHCEALDCPDASAEAKGQWADYRNHRDGLASNGPDPLPYVNASWESFHAANPYCLEDIMASINDLAGVLRSEGVSGAGDAGHMLNAGYRDGFLKAVVNGVVATLRSEGVSGAADPAHNGNQALLDALNAVSDRLAAVEAAVAQKSA